MSATDPTAVARFRYTVIAPLVTRTLAYGGHNALLREIVARPWTDPTGRARLLHVRTVERWVAAYRIGGWDALRPSPRRDRGTVRDVSPAPGALCQRGVAGDTLLTLKLPDAQHPDRFRQVYLVAVLDDATRYVVGAQFSFQDNRPRLEEVLKGAVVRHGVPEILHVDNGATYASDYLTRVCAELRIALRHSTVRRPEGKGKIERFFRRVDQQFTHEARAWIAQGQCRTLADLNTLWRAWVADGYHAVPHHGLDGQTPAAAWAASQAAHPPRRVDLATLHQVFLCAEKRRVDKTGVIQLAGNRYEVASILAGRTVVCRFDPFDLQAVHIAYQGQDYPDAVPLVLRHHHHREVPAPAPEAAAVPASGLNYAALLAARAAARPTGVRYGAGEDA